MKIGLFICQCGRNISGTINTEKLREYFTNYPNVEILGEQYLCSEIGLKKITDEINATPSNNA